MKTTYLIYKQVDGSPKLVTATQDEWNAIMKANRELPSPMHRKFVLDCIGEGNDLDRMYIEVTPAEHRAWNSKNTVAQRNRKEGALYQHLSMDAPIENADVESLHEKVASDYELEGQVLETVLLEKLVKALDAWRPWATKLLKLYMTHQKRHSTAWLADYCGVSLQMARRYKKDFEEFIKNFLS